MISPSAALAFVLTGAGFVSGISYEKTELVDGSNFQKFFSVAFTGPIPDQFSNDTWSYLSDIQVVSTKQQKNGHILDIDLENFSFSARGKDDKTSLSLRSNSKFGKGLYIFRMANEVSDCGMSATVGFQKDNKQDMDVYVSQLDNNSSAFNVKGRAQCKEQVSPPDSAACANCEIPLPNSQSTGVVYALQHTDDFINVYHWRDNEAPKDIDSEKPDPKKWGPIRNRVTRKQENGECKLKNEFGNANIVLSLELCGSLPSPGLEERCPGPEWMSPATCLEKFDPIVGRPLKGKKWTIEKIIMFKETKGTKTKDVDPSRVKPHSLEGVKMTCLPKKIPILPPVDQNKNKTACIPKQGRNGTVIIPPGGGSGIKNETVAPPGGGSGDKNKTVIIPPGGGSGGKGSGKDKGVVTPKPVVPSKTYDFSTYWLSVYATVTCPAPATTCSGMGTVSTSSIAVRIPIITPPPTNVPVTQFIINATYLVGCACPTEKPDCRTKGSSTLTTVPVKTLYLPVVTSTITRVHVKTQCEPEKPTCVLGKKTTAVATKTICVVCQEVKDALVTPPPGPVIDPPSAILGKEFKHIDNFGPVNPPLGPVNPPPGPVIDSPSAILGKEFKHLDNFGPVNPPLGPEADNLSQPNLSQPGLESDKLPAKGDEMLSDQPQPFKPAGPEKVNNGQQPSQGVPKNVGPHGMPHVGGVNSVPGSLPVATAGGSSLAKPFLSIAAVLLSMLW